MEVIQLESSHAPLILGDFMQISYLDSDNYKVIGYHSRRVIILHFKMHVSFVCRILSSIGRMIRDCDLKFVRRETITSMVKRPRNNLCRRYRSALLAGSFSCMNHLFAIKNHGLSCEILV